VASMGPRSIDRGNAAEVRRPRVQHPSLQWGRDRLIAEIIGVFSGAATGSALQWGRDRLIAEIWCLPLARIKRHPGFNGAAID